MLIVVNIYSTRFYYMKLLIHLTSTLLGKALQELLEQQPEGYHALAVSDLRKHNGFEPDFIVVDRYTIHNCELLKKPDTKIVLLDFCLSDDEMTSLLLSWKIDCVLATTSDLPLFKKALDKVMAGQIWIDNNRIKAIVRQGELAKAAHNDIAFSKKEREIIMLISQGFTNKAIAENLHISEQTVKTHLSRLFRKTRITRRSQLVPFALNLRVQHPV